MSILIEGMEMPKAQFQKSSTLYHMEGTIFIYPDNKARAELSVDYKERKSYSIVPITEPHDELIDASTIWNLLYDYADSIGMPDMMRFDKIMEAAFSHAPTIIPAEGGDVNGEV